MSEVSVNLWAIVMAAAAAVVIGATWYGVFTESWMKAIGNKKSNLSGASASYVASIAAAFITAYIFAYFIEYKQANTLGEGALLGFWIWLGFVATYSLMNTAWEDRSWDLWLINNGNQLLTLVVMGMILAVN
ncbi:DUF1761 domain-containing protein [Candidatus Berkelbacteria bacterium]|nr:DUF1761 domain-containing protein [Candidatus Berkelbacteria bacterium]